MKYLFLFIFIVFCCSANGQQDFSKLLVNHWMKQEILKKDSSKIFDRTINSWNFDLNFFSKDSVRVMYGGRAFNYNYRLKDSLLTFNKMIFQIKKLDDISLVLDQANLSNDPLAFKLIFRPKKLSDLSFTPESYLSKNGERVYIILPGNLEPYFIDKAQTAMDYVFEKFEFPEFKKGGFVVRFVINTKGEIKGTRILATSNDRYNQKLIAAVAKTKGKWLPAEFLGEKVNVEVEYDFNLDFNPTKSKSNIDSSEYSRTYFSYGNDFFERKSFRQAESYYKKAIDFDALNIDAYYQRAACNILLRKKEEACGDYQQLVFLEQTKAKELFKKYCK